MLMIRQVRMADNYNRGDYRWVIFHEGEFMRPVVIANDLDMELLIESYRMQLGERQPPAEDK